MQRPVGMKVAFSTADGEHVQGELRRASLLVLYDVTADGWHFSRISAFDSSTDRSEQRIEAIADAALVYVAAIGPSTVARLAARGIRAATAREGTPIAHVLDGLVRLVTSQRERPRAASC